VQQKCARYQHQTILERFDRTERVHRDSPSVRVNNNQPLHVYTCNGAKKSVRKECLVYVADIVNSPPTWPRPDEPLS
jgi:hypothetical protein